MRATIRPLVSVLAPQGRWTDLGLFFNFHVSLHINIFPAPTSESRKTRRLWPCRTSERASRNDVGAALAALLPTRRTAGRAPTCALNAPTRLVRPGTWPDERETCHLGVTQPKHYDGGSGDNPVAQFNLVGGMDRHTWIGTPDLPWPNRFSSAERKLRYRNQRHQSLSQALYPV